MRQRWLLHSIHIQSAYRRLPVSTTTFTRLQYPSLNLSEGCWSVQFDSTYPIQLNGIISQFEFHESIDYINRAIASKRPFIIWAIIFAVCILGGMGLFIAGGVTSAMSRSSGFPILVIVGFVLFGLGMIFTTAFCCIAQRRRLNRLQEAIARESEKYSRRSSAPCSWRLDTRMKTAGYHTSRRMRVSYHVSFDPKRNEVVNV